MACFWEMALKMPTVCATSVVGWRIFGVGFSPVAAYFLDLRKWIKGYQVSYRVSWSHFFLCSITTFHPRIQAISTYCSNCYLFIHSFVLDTLCFKMLLSFLYSATLLSFTSAHGVILAAQGEAGSLARVGFQGKNSSIWVQVEWWLTII